MSIVDFGKYKEERTPHINGPAVCTYCEYEWQAVAPEGTHDLECPSCGLEKGVWKQHIPGIDGHQHFKCLTCGRFYFHLMRDKEGLEYLLCVSCGTRTKR